MDIRPLLLLVLPALGSAAPAQVAAPSAGEPHVRKVVIEDEGARIDELRVRGVTTRITVKPKAPGAAAYEIIPLDAASRDDSYGQRGSRGASGQRVWNVLNF